jgi:hypothetical protein
VALYNDGIQVDGELIYMPKSPQIDAGPLERGPNIEDPRNRAASPVTGSTRVVIFAKARARYGIRRICRVYRSRTSSFGVSRPKLFFIWRGRLRGVEGSVPSRLAEAFFVQKIIV